MIKRALLTERRLYLTAALFSLVLSLWASVRESVINGDAICYLLSAKQVPYGIKTVMHLCGQAAWPFFSLLIYAFAQAFHVPYVVAAYGLDTIFSMFAVIAFMAIVAELGGNRLVMMFAALVILLHHDFNGVRQYIIRDHGYWAFYLVSLLCLLRFFNRPTWFYAISFSGSLLLATLFRIEGAIFLVILPCLCFFVRQVTFWQRVRLFLMLQSVLIILLVSLVSWFMLHPQASLQHFGRLSELQQQFYQGFMLMYERYLQSTQHLATYVLTYDSYQQASKLFVMMMIGWYLLTIISSLTLPYALLVIYAWVVQRIKLPRSGKLVLAGYILINIFITFAFLMQRFFLSKRYVLALTLTLLIYVPFALRHLYVMRAHYRAKIALIILSIAILICALGGIFDFGYSKAYIHQAGNWIDKELPRDARIFMNDIQLMYYSNRYGANIFQANADYQRVLLQQATKHYDYLALRIDKKAAGRLPILSSRMIKQFANHRGDAVIIYQNK